MGLFHNESNEAKAYEEVTKAPHKAELSHELIAAAASYEAAKKYEEHCGDYGQPDSHFQAQELIAALTGAFIDRMVETKGLDYLDKVKAHQLAKQQLQKQIDTHPEYSFDR
ncbi:hypothetical protein GYMLUDRAFT_48278 [Collybiopsis luxurians FD-317 M1]|uniref:Uncharacterized protein n=1 Tax=Collybiopsis luxurians FD-317 M1 TaxID=944289 RepID=A0A0D0BYF4_9AGAR|nr:hypothetical protein GYMLUDRAFT_48278 [Collybiopsis luxurians FD-317 M1]